jgi:hypothetical protein
MGIRKPRSYGGLRGFLLLSVGLSHVSQFVHYLHYSHVRNLSIALRRVAHCYAVDFPRAARCSSLVVQGQCS